MGHKYINLFTDFGFKKIFGTEVNKNLLIDFLNGLLHEQQVIKDLSYLQNEHLGSSSLDRRAIFDLYCENIQGEKFIVELQKVSQKFFIDRSIYYSTFAIQEQAKRGKAWNYELKHVYTVGIMDFIFKTERKYEQKHLTYAQLMDRDTKEVFYDKLSYVYLEMPKFTKKLEDCKTHFEKWLFFIRNLHNLENVPSLTREDVFLQLFQQAEIATYTSKERVAYENSLKYYRDLQGAMEAHMEKGLEKGKKIGEKQGLEKGKKIGEKQGLEKGKKIGEKQGLEKGKKIGKEEGMKEGIKTGKIMTAKELLQMGLSIQQIAKATGLSEEEIKQLL